VYNIISYAYYIYYHAIVLILKQWVRDDNTPPAKWSAEQRTWSALGPPRTRFENGVTDVNNNRRARIVYAILETRDRVNRTCVRTSRETFVRRYRQRCRVTTAGPLARALRNPSPSESLPVPLATRTTDVDHPPLAYIGERPSPADANGTPVLKRAVSIRPVYQ